MGYLLFEEDSSCIIPAPIYPKFFHLSTTMILRLDFKSKASQKLINQILINKSVLNLTSIFGGLIHPLNFSLQLDKQTNQDLLIEIYADRNISTGTDIKLTMEKKDWMVENTPTKLMIFEFTLNMKENLVICNPSKYYDQGILYF